MGKIIFITGTDTGVGKTVVTGLLLRHLRQSGCNALAIKPFCSGSRADARLLRRLQDNSLTLDEINPFFFKQPVAPAAGARPGKSISIDTVLRKIRVVSSHCDVLLVEGIGGLLVPINKKRTVADLIRSLGCSALIVSPNRLGTINHTLLTVSAMQAIGIKELKIILVGQKEPDISAFTNLGIIQNMAPSVPIFSVRNLGINASSEVVIKINALFLQKTLARILGDDIFILVRPQKGRKNCSTNTR
jgi:dethiobiotin synthetase